MFQAGDNVVVVGGLFDGLEGVVTTRGVATRLHPDVPPPPGVKARGNYLLVVRLWGRDVVLEVEGDRLRRC